MIYRSSTGNIHLRTRGCTSPSEDIESAKRDPLFPCAGFTPCRLEPGTLPVLPCPGAAPLQSTCRPPATLQPATLPHRRSGHHPAPDLGSSRLEVLSKPFQHKGIKNETGGHHNSVHLSRSIYLSSIRVSDHNAIPPAPLPKGKGETGGSEADCGTKCHNQPPKPSFSPPVSGGVGGGLLIPE
jgi:hypothetical protein